MNNEVSMSSVIGLIVRHTLGAISGGMVANGIVTGGQVETVAGGLTIVIVAAWSYWQKRKG